VDEDESSKDEICSAAFLKEIDFFLWDGGVDIDKKIHDVAAAKEKEKENEKMVANTMMNTMMNSAALTSGAALTSLLAKKETKKSGAPFRDSSSSASRSAGSSSAGSSSLVQKSASGNVIASGELRSPVANILAALLDHNSINSHAGENAGHTNGINSRKPSSLSQTVQKESQTKAPKLSQAYSKTQNERNVITKL
jgi:hypothetical protein